MLFLAVKQESGERYVLGARYYEIRRSAVLVELHAFVAIHRSRCVVSTTEDIQERRGVEVLSRKYLCWRQTVDHISDVTQVDFDFALRVRLWKIVAE